MPVAAGQEVSVFESAEARFEIAAKKLDLEQGVYRFLKCPEREITVYIPVALDNGQVESLHRLSRAALDRCAAPAKAVSVSRRLFHSTKCAPSPPG